MSIECAPVTLFGVSCAERATDCYVAVTTSHGAVDPFIRAWHSTLPNPLPGFRVAFVVYAPNLVPVAVATWGRPIARMEDQDTTLELTRYAIGPGAPRNLGSWALARMRKWIKANFPDVVRLTSYQDADVHDGALYKADNWQQVYEQYTSHKWTNRPGRRGTQRAHKIKWEHGL